MCLIASNNLSKQYPPLAADREGLDAKIVQTNALSQVGALKYSARDQNYMTFL